MAKPVVEIWSLSSKCCICNLFRAQENAVWLYQFTCQTHIINNILGTEEGFRCSRFVWSLSSRRSLVISSAAPIWTIILISAAPPSTVMCCIAVQVELDNQHPLQLARMVTVFICTFLPYSRSSSHKLSMCIRFWAAVGSAIYFRRQPDPLK